MDFSIITDSSSNLTNNIINNNNILVAPLIYCVDGQEFISYEKEKETDYKQFYRMLRERAAVTTSCVNKQTFYDIFKSELEKGKDILYIGFSSAISATFNSAELAAEEVRAEFPRQRILTVDTLGASLGEGLLVYYAAKLQAEGKTVEEVYDWLEDNKLKLCHYFTVDDLFYLFRGGRVQKSSYLIASLISIKPVMHMDNQGRLVPIGRVVGRRKAIQAIGDKLIESIVNPEEQMIAISHGDCVEDVHRLIEYIELKIKPKGYITNYVDPVVGAHSGPGTLAVFCLGSGR